MKVEISWQMNLLLKINYLEGVISRGENHTSTISPFDSFSFKAKTSPSSETPLPFVSNFLKISR